MSDYDRRVATLPAALRRDFDALVCDEANRAALRSAWLWSEGALPGLMLTGEVGTGKTTIAAAAAMRLMQRRAVAWASVPVLLANLTTSFSDSERAASVRVLTGRGPLVLDDLRVRPSPWAAEQLFAAVDGRYAAGAPLLVTTNLDPDEIAERFGDYGEAVATRLIEYCEAVHVGGQNRRLAHAREAL